MRFHGAQRQARLFANLLMGQVLVKRQGNQLPLYGREAFQRIIEHAGLLGEQQLIERSAGMVHGFSYQGLGFRVGLRVVLPA